MSVCSIGEVVAGLQGKRCRRRGAPVRRGSREAGSFEAGFWRRPREGEFARAMAGARALERETREVGRPQGAIGPVALELLAQLYRLARRFKGRLQPSLDFLMGAIKRSRTAIVRALRQLADAGFVEWTRRFVPVAIDGPGPRYRQTSNVYRLCLPSALRRLLGKRGKACPMPDDAAQHISDRANELDRMYTALSPREFAFAVADGALAESLAALGEAIAARDQRELSARSEPRHQLIQKGIQQGVG